MVAVALTSAIARCHVDGSNPVTDWNNVGRVYAVGTPIPDFLICCCNFLSWQHSMCLFQNQTCCLEKPICHSMFTQLMNKERYIKYLSVVSHKNNVILNWGVMRITLYSSSCCCINQMKASLTTGKHLAVFMLLLVIEVSSIIKGRMGFVGFPN
jgi:hypothetical protein